MGINHPSAHNFFSVPGQNPAYPVCIRIFTWEEI
jgi:hypothetical protein